MLLASLLACIFILVAFCGQIECFIPLKESVFRAVRFYLAYYSAQMLAEFIMKGIS